MIVFLCVLAFLWGAGSSLLAIGAVLDGDGDLRALLVVLFWPIVLSWWAIRWTLAKERPDA